MQNLLDNLKNLLQKDERLVSEGEFFKNKVIELALKLDKDLIKLLLSDEKMKEVFFIEVDKILIFDKDKFIKFVSNKQFLPDSYTAFKNKIGLIDGDGEFISQKKEVVLSWPYKDCVLEGGMTKEDQKRDEIFWNEILAPDEISRLLDPKVFTNAKRIDKDGEHNLDGFKTNENGDIKDNLIIKGNNLLALHSLKKRFAGKVKLIYIDPPYNTGNDSFKYNDAFNHSSWLTFMKNRLEVAKDLLRDDGVIFTQCDDNEQAYLKVLMDEVFGRENFVNHVSVKVKSSAGFKTVNKGVMETSEYILIYAKNKKASVFNKIYRGTSYDTNYKYVVENPSETETNWKFSSIDEKIKHEVDKLKSIELDKKILNTIILELKSEYSLKNPDKVFRYTVINDDAGKETVNARDLSKKDDKIYKIETIKGDIRYIHKGNQITFYQKKLKNIDEELQPSEQVTNIWTDISWEGIANEGAVKLKKGKKPEKLIKRILELSTQYGDVVLDFFAGTGTTCAVAHKMGRQYVGVEQLDNPISSFPVVLCERNVLFLLQESRLHLLLLGNGIARMFRFRHTQKGEICLASVTRLVG
jgi:adenine-specific DNA-methyltransferase